MIHAEGPAYTEEELEGARYLNQVSGCEYRAALRLVRCCRGTDVTPAEVLVHATELDMDPSTEFCDLLRLKKPPQLPAPSEGTLQLREPVNKAERRLARDIQKAVGARNTIIGQLARANRVIAKIERGLRQAGMITGGGS